MCIVLSSRSFSCSNSEVYKCKIATYQYSGFSTVHGQKFMLVNTYLGAFYPMSSLTVMLISTAIISHQLRRSSQFKKHNVKLNTGTAPLPMTTKEKQVVKMLVVIIMVYILNLFPRVSHYIAMLLVPDNFLMRTYNNVFWLSLYVLLCLDYMNSSVQMFIFYTMSQKYRTTIHRILVPIICSKSEKH